MTAIAAWSDLNPNRPNVMGVTSTMYRGYAIQGYGYPISTPMNFFFQPNPLTAPSTGSGQAYTSADTGALPIPALTGSQSLYVSSLSFEPANQPYTSYFSVVLCDILVGCSGIDVNSASLQTINTVSLPRYTTGEGVEIFIQTYTGNNAVVNTTYTINYTDSQGNAAVAVMNFFGLTYGNYNGISSFWVPLGAGSTGVRSIQSVQMSNLPGTAGTFGIFLIKRLRHFYNGFDRLGNPACWYNNKRSRLSGGAVPVAQAGGSQPFLALIPLGFGAGQSSVVYEVEYAVK